MRKRVFDLVIAVFALIPALPVMALCMLLVYIEDGRPVIFRQRRVGKDGRLFEMFKIRTMVSNSGQAPDEASSFRSPGPLAYKGQEAARTTRVGRLLRRFSLDELPQLFNVLAGTMSLVGPRPELPHLAEQYEAWQRERFKVLPGITGWWQINSRSEQPMTLHIEDDLYYIQNYSIWLDLRILIRTIWVVFTGKGAY